MRLAPAAVLLAASLLGCSSDPPAPVTAVDLRVVATADINAGSNGQGAPMVVRIYQLSAAVPFEGAQYAKLLDDDAATLGPALVKKDELVLQPGDTRYLRVEPPPSVQALGIFAAYRDAAHVQWRGVARVLANRTSEVTVRASARGLAVAQAGGTP